MTSEMAVHMGQQALMTALLIGGPLLLTALVVGSVISVLQAVTQVQEITLVFVPKIIAVFLMTALFGGWMLDIAVSHGTQQFLSISEQGP